MPDPEEYLQTAPRRNPYELPPPYSGITSVPPPPKGARNRLVLVLTGVLCFTVVVLSGVLFLVLRSAGQQQQTVRTTPAVVTPTPLLTTTAQYYTAIEHQDYTTAYSFVAPNLIATNGQTLTQELYTTGAQALDVAKGQVTSYTIGSISVNSNIESVTVTVTRANGPAYDVHLQLRQESGSWKVTSFDNI